MNFIRRSHFIVVICLFTAASAMPAFAGQARGTAFASSSSLGEGARLELPFEYEGPPPPELPATVVRDETGRTTVRAVTLAEPLRVDGLLDEALYTSVTPVS